MLEAAKARASQPFRHAAEAANTAKFIICCNIIPGKNAYGKHAGGCNDHREPLVDHLFPQIDCLFSAAPTETTSIPICCHAFAEGGLIRHVAFHDPNKRGRDSESLIFLPIVKIGLLELNYEWVAWC